jgi:hypothetical protein
MRKHKFRLLPLTATQWPTSQKVTATDKLVNKGEDHVDAGL